MPNSMNLAVYAVARCVPAYMLIYAVNDPQASCWQRGQPRKGLQEGQTPELDLFCPKSLMGWGSAQRSERLGVYTPLDSAPRLRDVIFQSDSAPRGAQRWATRGAENKEGLCADSLCLNLHSHCTDSTRKLKLDVCQSCYSLIMCVCVCVLLLL